MKFKLASLSFATIPLLATPLHAQSQTSWNGFSESNLQNIFNLNVTISNGSTVTVSDSYGLNTARAFEDLMSPQMLSSRYGTAYTNSAAVQGILDIRGLPAYASYAANSPVFVLRVPAFDEGGVPYQLTFKGQTRTQSYDQFKQMLDDTSDAEAMDLVRRLLKALARYSPIDPLAGNPGSAQGSLVRSTLDLSTGNSAIENAGGTKGTPGDPWMVGGSYTTFSSGSRYSGHRFDGQIQRSFRLSEGGRSLLKFEMPLSYSETNGARAASVQLGLGAEIPVVARRWSLEPRVGYALTASDQLGSIGHMAVGSISSRLVFDHIGRGRVVIGNMVGYSSTLSTAFTGYNFNPGLKNTILRNGVAYELPLKLRKGGRSLSVRGSYAMTNFFGAQLYANTFHEATLSFGVRGREEGPRAARDLIRLNISGTKAGAYQSLTAGLGFRF
jgi:hypothetical protein